MDQFWPTKWIFLLEDTQRYIVQYDGSIEAIASVPHCGIPSRARVLLVYLPFQTAQLIQQSLTSTRPTPPTLGQSWRR